MRDFYSSSLSSQVNCKCMLEDPPGAGMVADIVDVVSLWTSASRCAQSTVGRAAHELETSLP